MVVSTSDKLQGIRKHYVAELQLAQERVITFTDLIAKLDDILSGKFRKKPRRKKLTKETEDSTTPIFIPEYKLIKMVKALS